MTTTRFVKVRAFCTTVLAVFVLAWAPQAHAQKLPLRNLQVEVRQVQTSATERADAQGSVRIQGSAHGATTVDGGVQLSARQSQQSGTALQTVLVLNGYAARIELGHMQPLRFLQTVTRNGQTTLMLGTLLVQARTGFQATPRWAGNDTVELEFSAQQSPGMGTPSVGTAQSAVSSMVLVPMGEWSTVAQTEDSNESTTGNLLGGSNSSRRGSTEVQVRVSLR